MFSQIVLHRLRIWSALLLSLGLFLVAQVALAAGRVEWKTKELQEREGGSWRLEVSFFMPRAPDVPHVPMKFEFQPTAYYERDMVDGDKLQERTVPLENRQPLIESVDVGFLDSGSGKIESRTRFSFKVTRAHGYEAGEYKVTIRDGRNGQIVGTATNLKFKGENEIIDRRAMVFTGNDKKKKKDSDDSKKKDEAKESSDKSDADKSDKAASDESDKSSAAKDDEPSKSKSADEGDEGSDNGPKPIKEKPGGCGCRVYGQPSSFGAPSLALLAAVVLLSRRRTRRAA